MYPQTYKLWEDKLVTVSIYFQVNEAFGQKLDKKDQTWSRFHFISWQRKPVLGSRSGLDDNTLGKSLNFGCLDLAINR